jgi:hypothetical protein
MYTQKMYGLKIRYTTNADRQIGWSGANYDTIVVRKVQFSIDQIRTVVHSLVATTRKRLVEELMFIVPGIGNWHAEDILRFEMTSIIDNHAVIDEGFSFVYDTRNP